MYATTRACVGLQPASHRGSLVLVPRFILVRRASGFLEVFVFVLLRKLIKAAERYLLVRRRGMARFFVDVFGCLEMLPGLRLFYVHVAIASAEPCTYYILGRL